MKKHFTNLVSLAAAFALGVSSANAEVEIKDVQNYFEGFDNVATGKDQLAIGWNRIPDITNLGTIDTYRVEGIGGMEDERSSNLQVFSVQYQETWDDESGASYKTDDLILTPELKGHVEFYLKYKGQKSSYNTWKPSINIYKCTDNNDWTFSKGEEITIPAVTIPTDDWVKVALDVDDWTILGLRLENVYFDSFSADWAKIPQVQYLQLTGFQCLDGYSVYTDENGDVDMHFSIKVTNRGNQPITTDQSDFNIELQNQMQIVGTFPIDKDLEVGEVYEFTFTQPWKLKKLTEAETLYLQCVENISRHASSTSLQVRVEVFAPILSAFDGENELKGYLDLGVFNGNKELTLNFKNLGGKELNVNSITAPAGVTVDVTTPFKLASHQSKAVKFTFDDNGSIAGDIKIESDGIEPSVTELHYYGAGVDEETYSTSFDGKEIPARWFLEKKDAWIGNDRMGEALRSATSSSYMGKLISPLMTFGENGKVTMSISRWATWTETKLNVYTSTDRKTWTAVATLSSNNENTVFPESQYKFAALEIPVGAGDKYIAIEGLYANIDNFTGGKLIDVDNDIFIHSFTADSEGMVNYPITAALSLQNLGSKSLGAADYKAEVIINDSVYFTYPSAPTLKNTATGATEIKLDFTPHTAVAEGKIWARITVGDYVVESDSLNIVIAPEVAIATKQVGKMDADRSTANVPIRSGFNNSYSEFIYTAEMLGIKAGEKISGIAFPYLITFDRVAEKNITIWMQTTDTQRVTKPETGKAFSTDGMVKVYDNSITLQKTTPSGIFSNYAMLEFPFETPYDYDGKNIRFIIKMTSSAFVAADFLHFTDGTAIFTYSDDPINLSNVEVDLAWSLPVAILNLEKSATIVSGIITDGNDPIENARVDLSSKNVLYSATTDADGKYAISIIQTDLEYNINVAAHTFVDYKSDAAKYPTTVEIDTIAMTSNTIDPNTINVVTDQDCATITWGKLTPGSLDSNVGYTLDLDGEKIVAYTGSPEIDLANLSEGKHTIEIAAIFEPTGTKTAAAKSEFVIELNSLSNNIANRPSITTGKGYISITSNDNALAKLFATDGTLITTKVVKGHTALPCPSGLYILQTTINNRTFTNKVIVK